MGKLSFLLNYEIDRKYEHADIGDGRLHIPLLEGTGGGPHYKQVKTDPNS